MNHLSGDFGLSEGHTAELAFPEVVTGRIVEKDKPTRGYFFALVENLRVNSSRVGSDVGWRLQLIDLYPVIPLKGIQVVNSTSKGERKNSDRLCRTHIPRLATQSSSGLAPRRKQDHTTHEAPHSGRMESW